jgi:U3 small nucleolar RNA-associated protein 14
MLEDVVGAEAAAAATGRGKKQRPPTQAAVIDEAYPESEFNVNPGAAGRCVG